jgi:hypothetical protein
MIDEGEIQGHPSFVHPASGDHVRIMDKGGKSRTIEEKSNIAS